MPNANDRSRKEPAPSGATTRQRLLAACAESIVERGWGAVTTRAVAERAGVNQALVHYHFGSIDNLRRDAVVAQLMPAIEELAGELLDERPLTESIPRVMRLIDGFDMGTGTGVLMAEALLRATRDPTMTEAMSGIMASWSDLLGPRLVVAQERGVVRADIPAERLSPVLAAVLDGFLIQRMADPKLDPDAAAETLIALLSPPREDAI